MAFLGVAVVPMKLKRFRETRKFYPCNFCAWYPKLSHVVFNTTSHNIQSHIIHFHKLFPKLSHTFRTLNHTTIPQHSLHHTIKSLISHHIISNTTINGIKYNYTQYSILRLYYICPSASPSPQKQFPFLSFPQTHKLAVFQFHLLSNPYTSLYKPL